MRVVASKSRNNNNMSIVTPTDRWAMAIFFRRVFLFLYNSQE